MPDVNTTPAAGCNLLDPATWPVCGQQLGAEVGKWLDSNACGDLCIDGRVVASKPCPPGRTPTSLGCGSKQPTAPVTPAAKTRAGISVLLDTYTAALERGDPLTIGGTVLVVALLYKKFGG